jgi:hypothetical protein
MNQCGKIPIGVDSSDLFKMYKPNGEHRNITYDYFNHYNKYSEHIEYRGLINYDWGWQFWYYSHLDFSKITPLVRKYFSPNQEILTIVARIEEKYGISGNYENICVLFHRGNDKPCETPLCKYEDIIQKSIEIRQNNPEVRFLLQSDETEFIEELGNCIRITFCYEMKYDISVIAIIQ